LKGNSTSAVTASATIPSADVAFTNIAGQTGYHEMVEMTAPSAPAANTVRVYAEDNGSGKTRLMARFATGVAQQIAIEP
jgi:hypothetical protein